MRYTAPTADGRREFIGENASDPTSVGEKVRLLLSGNAFDLSEERTPDSYAIDSGNRRPTRGSRSSAEQQEGSGRKSRGEHLPRVKGSVAVSYDPYVKTDARTVEFRVKGLADGEKKSHLSRPYSPPPTPHHGDGSVAGVVSSRRTSGTMRRRIRSDPCENDSALLVVEDRERRVGDRFVDCLARRRKRGQASRRRSRPSLPARTAPQ